MCYTISIVRVSAQAFDPSEDLPVVDLSREDRESLRICALSEFLMALLYIKTKAERLLISITEVKAG